LKFQKSYSQCLIEFFFCQMIKFFLMVLIFSTRHRWQRMMKIDKQLGFSFYKFVYVYAFTIFQMQRKQWIIRCYIFVDKWFNSYITIYTICWAIFYPQQNMIMFISSILKFYYKLKIINFTKDGWILLQRLQNVAIQWL
jgi:hypothetical protein